MTAVQFHHQKQNFSAISLQQTIILQAFIVLRIQDRNELCINLFLLHFSSSG